MTAPHIWPVLLSGGSGSRLWPLSRTLYPKQLLPLHGEQTLLQQTAGRCTDTNRFHRPIVVSNEEHRFIVAEQMRTAGRGTHAIILEPEGRNTAPAIALAALLIANEDPDGLMLVMPSDHVISDQAAFDKAVTEAAAAAVKGRLMTFGILPSGPETGYGYIQQGTALADLRGCHDVARFVEKPDLKTAEDYIEDGSFYWNSGIFLFKASAFLGELETQAPNILTACRSAMAEAEQDLDFLRPAKEAFRQSPNISVDYAVMEKTDRAGVVPVDMGWSDVGSWKALWSLATRDASGNASKGDVMARDSRNCYLRAEGPTIAAVGLDNMAVITTKDAVLIAPLDRSQEVKDIVADLKSQGRTEHEMHTQVFRPWGSYETTDIGERFQTKRIIVKPGEKLSLQKHHHRAEHWIVVQGTARITRDDEVFILSENESCYIPLGAVHRLENPGKIPLHLIEVQSGAYLGEDDIVRFEDQYGRSDA